MIRYASLIHLHIVPPTRWFSLSQPFSTACIWIIPHVISACLLNIFLMCLESPEPSTPAHATQSLQRPAPASLCQSTSFTLCHYPPDHLHQNYNKTLIIHPPAVSVSVSALGCHGKNSKPMIHLPHKFTATSFRAGTLNNSKNRSFSFFI